jgi:uncharacterized protein (TIGR01777 family)
MQKYKMVSRMPVSAEALYAWHAAPGAFERLAPPWEDIQDVRRMGGLEDGAETRFVVKKGPVGVPWVARHQDHVLHRQFRDVQVEGPFAYWNHLHCFDPVDDNASDLRDELTYSPPGGPPADWVAGGFLRGMVERMFSYRHTRTRVDLERHVRYAAAGRRRILVSGASGMIGRALVAFLQGGGHEVWRLVRRAAGPEEIEWNPAQGELNQALLEGFDAVIHLAGEGIAEGRWTQDRKARILNSRVGSTRLLARALAQLERKPEVFISASAIGFYGNRGEDNLDEGSLHGAGFLADVCRAWEAETGPAAAAGIRVVKLRTGIVLSPRGGALSQMLPAFQAGAGGPVGSGKQVMSWIALDDVVGAIQHAMFTPTLKGAVNLTAPHPVTSEEFARALGKVLHRPSFVPLPALAVHLIFGELGQSLLLDGARVHPRALQASGFHFLCPDLETALRHELALYEPVAAVQAA